MINRIILIIVAVALTFNLYGCESKQKYEDRISGKKEVVTEETGNNVTEQPAATMKPIEKLDIVWLEHGIIPQESIELEIESEPGSTQRTKLETTGTVISVMIYESGGQGFGYGFINGSGNIILHNTYDFVDYPNSELIRVRQYNEGDYTMKFGYIDQNGEEVIPLEYDDASNFSDDLAKVGKRNNDGTIKYGYIDSSGKEIIPCEYDEAASFSNSLASVAKKTKVNYSGNEYKELRYGFIDKTGKRIVPLKYRGSETYYVKNDCFENPIVKVSENGSDWGYIDTTGKVVIPLKYFDIAMYGEGLFRVIIDDEIGYIDAKGKEVIPFLPVEKYVYSRFSEGLVAKVKVKKKNWTVEGFFDQTGESQ